MKTISESQSLQCTSFSAVCDSGIINNSFTKVAVIVGPFSVMFAMVMQNCGKCQMRHCNFKTECHYHFQAIHELSRIIVWGAISANSYSSLVLTASTLTAFLYVDDIPVLSSFVASGHHKIHFG